MYKTNNGVKPYIAAVCFTLLTGFSFLGIKACQSYASQLEILTYRFNFAFVAAVIVWFLGIFQSAIKDGSAKGKPKKMFLLASCSYIVFMIFQVLGIFYTTSVVGSILFAITPIIVQIIASVVLKEKSTFKQNIFVVITVASLIYMIVAGAGTLEFKPIGIFYLVISCCSMAVSNIAMRYVRENYRPFDITFSICILGFILFNLATIVLGVKNGTLGDYFKPLENTQFIVGTAYLGIGCILFTSQLISYMLSKLPALKATIFSNVSTAISIVAGVAFLGEPFHVYHFVCVILIIIGVIGVTRYGNK